MKSSSNPRCSDILTRFSESSLLFHMIFESCSLYIEYTDEIDENAIFLLLIIFPLFPPSKILPNSSSTITSSVYPPYIST